MATNVGSISIDTSIDSKGVNKGVKNINKSMSNLTKSLKTVGIAILAAFSVKAIVNYRKEANKMYSDQFANERKLGEALKQRTGANSSNIQSILDYIGVLEQEGIVSERVQVAGAAQLATYLDSQEALSSLLPAMNNLIVATSGFNGTQGDAINIANKFGKVMAGQLGALNDAGITFTSAQESVLRYGNELERANTLVQVITDNFGNLNESLASTDLGRQQQLKNELEAIKVQFGAIFTQLGTLLIPVFNVFNSVLATTVNYLRGAAQGLTDFLSKTSSGVAKEQSDAIADSVSNQKKLTDETKKTGKAAKGALSSFDNLNTLSNGSSSTESSVTSAQGIGGTSNAYGLNEPPEIPKSVKNFFDNLTKLSKKTDGLKLKLSVVVGNIAGVIKPMVSEVMDMLNGMVLDVQPIVAPLVSWLRNDYLTVLGSVFMLLSQTMGSSVSLLTTVYGDTFSVLMGIVSTFVSTSLPMFSSMVSSIVMLFSTLINSVFNIFTLIWQVGIKPSLDVISKIVTDLLTILSKAWDEHGVEIVAKISEALSSIEDTFTKLIDFLKPLITIALEEITWLWDKHISVLVETVLDFAATLIAAGLDIYNDFISPLIDFIIGALAPSFTEAFTIISDVVGTLIGTISDVASAVFKTLGGIIDFITGVFTGDFVQAFEGIGNTMTGIFDGVWATIKGVINLIIGGVNSMIRGINNIQIETPDWIPGGLGGKKFGFSIPKIPKLATGAVIPPNNEFLAVLGDQKSGTNIETPLSTMIDAFKVAMQGMNTGGREESSEPVVVDVNIDGDTLVEAVLEGLSRRQRQTGKSGLVV